MAEIYDVYHDESKEGGYWHGFLFVPRSTRADLLGLLAEARTNTGYQAQVHYASIKSNTSPRSEKAIIVEAWTSIGCASLQQQKFHTDRPKVLLGRNARHRGSPKHKVLDKLLRCKFVLFRVRDDHKNMFAELNQLQCIETTFRMGLKGGVHKLFNAADPITIGDVFIDGDEQYIGQFGRSFDIDRTLRRLDREKRPYVSFLGQPKLIAQRSDHRRIEGHQRPEDSHLLQLCDILIGGFRFHAFCPKRGHIRWTVSLQCRELLSHEQQNVARMRQSRYFTGFSLQEAWLQGGEWRFAPLPPAQDRGSTPVQLSLHQPRQPS